MVIYERLGIGQAVDELVLHFFHRLLVVNRAHLVLGGLRKSLKEFTEVGTHLLLEIISRFLLFKLCVFTSQSLTRTRSSLNFLVCPLLRNVDFVDGFGGGVVDFGQLGRSDDGHVLLVDVLDEQTAFEVRDALVFLYHRNVY